MAPLTRIPLVSLCCAALLFSGCAATRTELAPPVAQDGILVIGSMDMSEAESMLNRVDIERLSPNPALLEHQFSRIKQGSTYIFYSEALTPGQYRFTGFGGKSGNVGRWYELKGDPRFTLNAPSAGIYYIGAYKVRATMPDGIIGRIAYQIVPVAGPSEREVLLKLQPLAKDPYWKGMIERRLQELPQ